MTISSPIGTVHEYTFTAADVLLNGVSLGIGALTSWTLPRHDGDIRVAVAGGAGGAGNGTVPTANRGGGGGVNRAGATGVVIIRYPYEP